MHDILYPKPDREEARIAVCHSCNGTGNSQTPIILYDKNNNEHTKNMPCETCQGCKHIWQYTENKPAERPFIYRNYPDIPDVQRSEKLYTFSVISCLASIITFIPGIFVLESLCKYFNLSETISVIVTFGPSITFLILAVVFDLMSSRLLKSHDLKSSERLYAPAFTERAPLNSDWKSEKTPLQDQDLDIEDSHTHQLQQEAS